MQPPRKCTFRGGGGGKGEGEGEEGLCSGPKDGGGV